VIARPESWSQPAEPQRLAVAAAVALVLFIGSWSLLHVGFYKHGQIVDTPVYQTYGDAIAHGQVPYRDFGVEYPPGALPVFVLPALGHAEPDDFDAFRRSFEVAMWMAGAVALLAAALVLRSLRARPLRGAAALGFVALAPLAVGSLVLSRFDLWPAALTVVALAAFVGDRERLGFGVLGLAVATKIYPGVLLPLGLAYVWRRHGRREAAIGLGVFAGVIALVFLPFVALSPGGVWGSIVRQMSRPLQIESLGSALLLVAHHVLGTGVTVESSHGSQNLAGGGASALAAGQTVLQAAALVAVWVLFARGRPERERLVRSSAAAVCAFVALGKVLSPQFLVWLVPLVPLVRGRRGAAAAALLALALVLTQLWFPFRYWQLALELKGFEAWLVLARDLVLVGLLLTLAWPERREPGAAAA
jgi:hypothetical protein